MWGVVGEQMRNMDLIALVTSGSVRWGDGAMSEAQFAWS